MLLLNRNEIQRKRSLMLQNLRMWKHINATFKAVSTYVLGFRLPGRKEWISDTTWELIESRRELKAQINRNNTPELVYEYRATNKKIGKSARPDKRKWMSNIARYAQRKLRTIVKPAKSTV